MYTILITNQNTVIATEQDAIMEKSSLVDKLIFIVEKEYNDFDMADFTLTIQGYLPITHEITVETLEMIDDNYKDLYYAYKLPIDTDITSEAGTLLYSLSFLKSEVDPDSNATINYVRNIAQGQIIIHPISDWFTAPNTALSQLNQILLTNQQNISALRAVADQLYSSAPNNIKIDIDEGEIYLVHGTTRIGTGITLDDLNEALDSAKTEDNVTTINI